ncbi:Fibrinogen C domain-containing protein 1 [Labeo rohita]|uniref:Fibrinogen C domain-containing protein 1 n=1 Tax=Labeo rohita TaxID=84645 RepID=A0ABQ8MP82_LABRO|nr:Fibrinogen C domain-containing protein 1 [Labeo rohita]
MTDGCGISQAHGNVDEDTVVSNAASPPLLVWPRNYELRIDLEDFENSTAFAQYGVFGVGLFSVDPEDDGYPLTIADYTGTADRDNDHSENNCASFYHGAWWYRNCHTSNLNGQYLRGQHTSYADGIEWSSWTGWQYSLKFTEMKIRPTREERESK